jgi:hypothetical protein
MMTTINTMLWEFWARELAVASVSPCNVGMTCTTLKERARGTAPRMPHQLISTLSRQLNGDQG